jgi:hypothetical protein
MTHGIGKALAALAAIALLPALGALGATPAAADSHTPGATHTALAPTKADRAGTDQDEYCIPDGGLGDSFASYLVDGVYAPPGCHLTNGRTQVTITTQYDRGTWTFDYSADPGLVAAPDAYGFDFGKCISNPVGSSMGDRRFEVNRMVTMTMTNTADLSGRYIRALYAHAVVRKGFGYEADFTQVTRLGDGQSATVNLFKFNPAVTTPYGTSEAYPGVSSGLRAGKTWTLRVTRSDLRNSVWEPGASPYTAFEQDVYVPSCHMTRVKRGYEKTRVTITAHDYWNALPDRRFRIRMYNKRGKTVYRQIVPIRTGTTKTITLRKSALPKRIIAKGMPHLVVEQWDPRGTYDTVGDGKPGTHWGEDFGGTGYSIPVWRTRKR